MELRAVQMKTDNTKHKMTRGRLGIVLGVLLALVLCGTFAAAPLALATDQPAAEDATTTAAPATPTDATTPATTDATTPAVTTDAAPGDLVAAPPAADEAAPAGTADESFLLGNDVLWFGEKGDFKECIVANDLMGAGETITINGAQVAGSIRIAGRVLSVINSSVAESVTLAGQDVKFEGGSAHVVAMAGQDVTFSGTADKLYAGAGTVKIDGVVNGDVHVSADKVEVGPNAVITGTLKGTAGEEPTIAAEATVGATDIKIEEQEEETTDPIRLFDWRVIVFSTLSGLLIALLSEWLAGGQTADAAALIKERPGSYLLSAILGTVFTPLFVVLLCVPIVTIPAALALLLELVALGLVSCGFFAAVLARLILPKANRFVTTAIFGALLGAATAMPFAGAPLRGLLYALTLGYFVCAMRKGMAERRSKRDEEVIQF